MRKGVGIVKSVSKMVTSICVIHESCGFSLVVVKC